VKQIAQVVLSLGLAGCMWAGFGKVVSGKDDETAPPSKQICAPAREPPPVTPFPPPCPSIDDHVAGCKGGTGRCTKCGHPCPNGPPLGDSADSKTSGP